MPVSALFAVFLLPLVQIVHGDEFPLTQFPLYTQLARADGFCVSSASSTFRISFGCDLFTPAACLCTDPKSSLKVATAIRGCIGDYPTSYSILSSATQLWASYCLTNAGVSAQDETLLQDIPLYTQVTTGVRYCASSVTVAYITSLGCDDYTKAPCLCGTSASSYLVANKIGSCIGTYSPEQQQSGSMLWSSYCAVNMKQPAVRSVGAPIAVSATVTGGGSGSTQTASKTTRATSTPLQTSQNSPSSQANGQGTSDSGSQSGGSSINWEAIGAVIGVVGILVAIGIAWWTNKRNQWLQNVLVHMHLSQAQRPQPQVYDVHNQGMHNQGMHDIYTHDMQMQRPKAWA